MFRLLAVRAASLGTTGAVPLSPVVGTTGLTLAPARAASSSSLDSPLGSFESRHLGPREQDQRDMLKTLKLRSIGQLVSRTVPPNVKLSKFKLPLDRPESEALALNNLRKMLAKNKIYKNFIGGGYYGTVLPPPILRNLLENPSWYTSYTPYQAEVSQGRLESLMNFQVMVSDLTGLPVAGASLLDEATAAGEALGMCVAADKRPGPKVFVVDEDVLPQTLAVLHSRAEPRGVQVLSVNLHDPDVRNRLALGGFATVSGVLAQYPSASGQLADNMQALADVAHRAGALFAVATDLMALTLLTPPGEFGADIAFGSAQRFGVPPGFGGPHAAFFATSQTYVRSIPGRIIGMSRDSSGKPAYRMALQTREQHIRRERATSNICTAQALLANIAAMYAVYHGPEGLRRIAANIHALAYTLQQALKAKGLKVSSSFFDTVAVYLDPHQANEVHQRAQQRKINLGRHPQGLLVAFDELSTLKDVKTILSIFAPGASTALTIAKDLLPNLPLRTSVYLQHPIFNTYRSETELTRYIHRLADKDISLTRSMISLGSCTMKLNAAAEMIPVTWPEVASIHPFAPAHQVKGYLEMISHLEKILSAVTGFAATSLQPNAGSQGELTGLLVIRRFLQTRDAGQPTQRDVCLIPRSAHGTNPASAAMAGMKIVVVACRDDGEVDLDDLAAKISENADRLACLMVTYPSTHGVFEAKIKDIVDLVHNHGGLVYMDGANMNAQCGLLSPGDIGADVCHLNLHKTFCIPHGGGGPGVGPICVAKHLEPFLPGYPSELIPDRPIGTPTSIDAVSAAPYGSASILPIPYMYLRMMGSRGIVRATQTAILSANYMAKKLSPYYPVLYTGDNGYVAHEFIIDCRGFEETSGVVCEDIAKRLIDFGFHAPTMSFPVPGTLMIEPTESESKEELDRFIDALIQIRAEIDKIAAGVWPKDNNPLKHAPHTAEVVTSDSWDRPYTRAEAVYPLPWVATRKYWPPVGRVDNVYGDKNLNVSCPCEPIESYLKP